MSAKDIVTKDYVKECEVFADAFNQYIYKGEQVIKAENLRPLDTTITGVPYGADGAGVPVQRFRDVLKSVTAMEDGNTVYLLLAIEAQSEVHHAMPVRNMVYDALQYAAQVEEAARSHRQSRKAKDKAKLNEMVQKDDRFRAVDRKAATVISTVTGVEFEVNEEEEKVDMCEGMRGLLEDATNEGLERGLEQGMQDERMALARKMLEKGKYTYEEIAELTSLSVEEVKALEGEKERVKMQ